MAQLDSKKHLAMTQASAVMGVALFTFSLRGGIAPPRAEKKRRKNEGKTKENERKLILMMIV